MDTNYIEHLRIELERCCSGTLHYNTYTDKDGNPLPGGGESDVKKHLTSGRDYVSGRQWRFPGITNGWIFESRLKEAGYHIVSGKNYCNQSCRVVVKM